MRKIFFVLIAALLAILYCQSVQSESVLRSRPETSRSVMHLDSDLNFKVSINYSDVAGGVEKSTIYIMIAFKQDDTHVAYDIFPVQKKIVQHSETIKDGTGEGSLEFTVCLSEETDVQEFKDVLEIRLFLVDAQGKKTKSKSLKLEDNQRDQPKSFQLEI